MEEQHADPETEDLAAELARSRAAERAAVERLRTALLATEPSLEPSLVTGETIEEVDASFAASVALLTRLREQVAREQAGRIPPGAPGRSNAPHARTPFEKIRAGLEKS